MSARRALPDRVRVVRVREEFLTGSLGDQHDRVMAPAEPFGEHIENATIAVQREGHLRDRGRD